MTTSNSNGQNDDGSGDRPGHFARTFDPRQSRDEVESWLAGSGRYVCLAVAVVMVAGFIYLAVT